MKLTIERTTIGRGFASGDGCMNGTLYVDMVRFCYTGEPCGFDKAGILPVGTYKAVLTYSHDDEKAVPEIIGIDGNGRARIFGRDGVSRGGICVGRSMDGSSVIPCEDTLNRVVGIIQSAEDIGESVFIQIRDRQ